MNLLRRVACTCCTIAVLNTPAIAGPLVDKATEAERLWQGGDPAGALARLDEAVQMAWNAGPLFIRTAVYVDDATGYGQYSERLQGSSFAPDEKLVIYVEPVGYGYGNPVIGLFKIGFDVDLTMLTKEGEVLFAQDDLVRKSQTARTPGREFYLKLTLTLTGMKPGSYDLSLRLRDQNSEKYAMFQMPLTIAE